MTFALSLWCYRGSIVMHIVPDNLPLRRTDKEEREDIRSFYHLGGVGEAREFCQGTACFVARHLKPDH